MRISKKYVFMIVNGFGQPLYNKDGMCWFFVSESKAKKYLKDRKDKRFDLLKKRIIVRLDWKQVYELGRKSEVKKL